MEGISGYNFFTDNRWIANIPTRNIDPTAESDLAYNLVDFDIPTLGLSTSQVSQLGYTYEYPTNVREYNKELTFQYILESDFKQYKFLYQWYTKIASEAGAGVQQGISGAGMMEHISTTIRTYLLSEYSNVVVNFKFNNCFLKELGGFKLKYVGDAQVMVGTFKVAFENFELE
jgi:hypothetical protein